MLCRLPAILFAVVLLGGFTGCRTLIEDTPMPAPEPMAEGQRPTQAMDLQVLFDTALAEGRDHLKLPPGRFQVHGAATLMGATDFTLDGRGTTLIFPPDKGMITFDSCRNLTVTGLTVDCDPLPFTQGTITRVSSDPCSFDYEVHAGYPQLTSDTLPYGKSGVFAFDPDTLRWRQDVPDLYPKTSEVLSPTTGRITMSVPLPGYANLRVGDYVAFKNPKNNAFFFRACNGVTVRDVTVLTAPCAGFLLRCCTGSLVFDGCVIRRGPKPAGATQERLLSTVADGFNVGYSRQGPTMTNCDFSNMGDDAVNLHGTIMPVTAVDTLRSFWIARPYAPEFAYPLVPGDEVRFLDADSYGITHTATIATVSVATADATQLAAWGEGAGVKPGKALYVVHITLTEDTKLAPGMKLDFPSIACPNFVFRDNYFHDHRARGLRLGASHGVIENNRFERLKSTAISLGPHAIHNEGGWVSDIVVRGNRIRDVCFDDRSVEGGSYNAGAITVQHFLHDSKVTYPQANRTISILDNRIDLVGGPGILATSAQDLVIRGNHLTNTQQRDCSHVGEKVRLTAKGMISLNYCRDVTVDGNAFGDRGPSATGDVVRNPAE